MKMTSAQAAKLLRQWNESLKALQRREENTKTFLASLGEDLESVRPEYDYAAMQAEQAAIEANIRKLKHTLNVFNTTTIIPEFEMTIDQMLIYLPQLTNRLEKLSRMKELLPKQRENALYSRNSAIIDYRYANYDIQTVEKDYEVLAETLAKAQTALDYINNTVLLEVDLPEQAGSSVCLNLALLYFFGSTFAFSVIR